jgi:hypothetical protein
VHLTLLVVAAVVAVAVVVVVVVDSHFEIFFDFFWHFFHLIYSLPRFFLDLYFSVVAVVVAAAVAIIVYLTHFFRTKNLVWQKMNKTTLRRHNVQAIESRKYKQRGHKQNRLFSTKNTYIACDLYYFFQALEQACQTQTFLKRKKSSAAADLRIFKKNSS